MSPTSFQTAPSRDILLCLLKEEWAEVDSNHRSNLQQIYSLSPLATRESTHLQNTILLFCSAISRKADDRTRTDNLLITNQLLCQLSHIGIFNGTNRARTYDPLLVRQMLSQLSYDPILTTPAGLEPATSAVTGRRSNQLSHEAIRITSTEGCTFKTSYRFQTFFLVKPSTY